MNIRTRITLIFFSLVTIIVTAFSASIYYFSSQERKQDFVRRLQNRAANTVRVLLDVRQIDAALLKRLERENPASLPDQFVRIYDTNGKELYSSDEQNIFSVDTLQFSSLSPSQPLLLREDDYEVIGFRYQSTNGDYVVIAGARDIYGKHALSNLRNIIVITFCASLLIVSIIAYFYAGRVLKPITRIVEEVEHVTEQNLDRRLAEGNGKDELGKLAKTFNRMLSRLESAFKAQRAFIANASHELKTPFTVMAGEIEVTLLQPREKEYYIKILRSVLEGIKRFNKLSTQLLLLAQTSSDTSHRKLAVLRIDDILWEAKEELEKYHPEYVIAMEFAMEINQDILQVAGDEQLLKVAMMNLMDNGCKYSTDNRVVVGISKEASGRLAISFVNDGEGIAEAELDRVFNPFYRGRSGGSKKGFGVGLSLAEKIVTLHEGTIAAESTPGVRTIFTILLPVSS